MSRSRVFQAKSLAQYLRSTLPLHSSDVLAAGSVQQDDANLRRTVQAVLQAVKVAKVESVAVPLLGAGAAGWPTALAAKALVGQVVEMISSTVVGRTLKVSIAQSSKSMQRQMTCTASLSCT